MGNDALDRMSADDAHRRIAAMRELLDKAESTLTDTVAATDDSVGTAGDAAAIRADHLAKLQRLSGWALRDAVTRRSTARDDLALDGNSVSTAGRRGHEIWGMKRFAVRVCRGDVRSILDRTWIVGDDEDFVRRRPRFRL